MTVIMVGGWSLRAHETRKVKERVWLQCHWIQGCVVKKGTLACCSAGPPPPLFVLFLGSCPRLVVNTAAGSSKLFPGEGISFPAISAKVWTESHVFP